MPYEIRQGDIPGIQSRCDRRFSLPPVELWKWLTETDRLRRWLADEVTLDTEGVRLESRDENGAPLVEHGKTVAREDGVVWVLAFERLDDGWEMATELRLELSREEPCRLTILQRGFERLSLSRCLSVWELYRRRWRKALERLAAAIEAESV